jgi:hypothetical protein
LPKVLRMSSSVRRSKRKALDSEPLVPEGGTPAPRRSRKSSANASGGSQAAGTPQAAPVSTPQDPVTPASSQQIYSTPSVPESQQVVTGEGGQESPMSPNVARSIKSKVRWQAGASAALKSIASEKRAKNAEEGISLPSSSLRRSSTSPKIWSIGSLTKVSIASSFDSAFASLNSSEFAGNSEGSRPCLPSSTSHFDTKRTNACDM